VRERAPCDEAGSFLAANRGRLARAVTDEHFRRDPGRAARYGEAGRARCAEDAGFHLDHLRAAVAYGLPELFVDYVGWAKTLLAARGIPDTDLLANLDVIRAVLSADAAMPGKAEVLAVLAEGTVSLAALLAEVPSFIDPSSPYGGLAQSYLDALLAGDRRAASALVLDAVAGGLPLEDVYLEVFQVTQQELGRLWQMNRISVAEEHYCTAATQLVMSLLYPFIFSTKRAGRRIVVACVAEELHEIGARMVADLFEMKGWDSFYLGANTPTDGVVSTVVARRPHVVALSATMSRHVAAVASLVRAIRARPEAAPVPIIVGGRPFNLAPALVRQVGADGSARSAKEALALGHDLAHVDEPG
jgi:MerR family transcriptional regulator, light-induced transcriptional regulator